MKSRTLLSTVALLLLAGCAVIGGSQVTQSQPRELQRARACHDLECEIAVTVNGCDVSVQPYFIVMVPQPDKARPGLFHPITVTWKISGDGTFAKTDAIRWKDPGATRVFTAPKLAANQKNISFSNSGTRGVYHYGVRVIGAKGQPCDELDPTGINDPP